MGVKQDVQSVIIGGFLIIVFLPFAFGFLRFILAPNPSLEQWVQLFKAAVIPWWVGIAETSPLLLVIVFLIVSWADADEVL